MLEQNGQLLDPAAGSAGVRRSSGNAPPGRETRAGRKLPRPIITPSAPDSRQHRWASSMRVDVAIADHRNADRVLDLADEAPIGRTVIELIARAAVHRDHLNPRALRLFWPGRGIAVALVPAGPHLQRHRNLTALTTASRMRPASISSFIRADPASPSPPSSPGSPC